MDQDPTQPYTPPEPPAPPAPFAPVAPAGLEVPITAAGGRPRRRNPLRYVVAALVVVLVAATGIGATVLLTGSSGGASTLSGYAPADSVLYMEGRLDLPGSQRAEVARALAAFPGFADQAALNTKLGELLDRVLRAATNGKHDYQTEIAPWFGGQLAIAGGPSAGISGMIPGAASPAASATTSAVAALPPCTGSDAAASPAPSGATPPETRALLLLNVTDVAKAEAWVRSGMAEANKQTTDRTCDGVVVHVAQASGRLASIGETGWATLGGKVLVAGDLDSIRLAIATKGTSGLSTVANFQKAMASLSGDHVGLLYEAIRSTVKAQAGSMGALSGAAGDTTGTAGAAYGILADLMPEWIAGGLKASNGNFVVDTVQPKSDLQSGTNRASDLAALAPPKTIVLTDAHDVGKVLGTLRDKFAADPKLQQYVKQLDDALNLAGGFSATVGWIGDAGLAVTRDGSKVSGGILVRPADAAAATRLFTQLRALVGLGGGSSGLAFKDEDYKGVKISSVDLSAMAPLLQSSMGSSGMTVPSDLQFVYAITDKVVVLTLDPSFAKAVIDAAQGGDSLAKDARFSALLSQAGATNTGLFWVDVTSARELVEGMLPASNRAKYDADVRPYLLPLDALVSVNQVDSDLARGTMTLSIKH